MEAGDADVVQPIDRVAHHLGGDRRFFGDGQVGRPGGRDDNRALARGRVRRAQRDGSGQLVKGCVGHVCADGVERVARRSA